MVFLVLSGDILSTVPYRSIHSAVDFCVICGWATTSPSWCCCCSWCWYGSQIIGAGLTVGLYNAEQLSTLIGWVCWIV
jgi:hypothetical protein